MEDEIKRRQELLDQLKREVTDECVHLQKLEESLAFVTVDYNVIMDRRRREAEEELRKRLEERARERAAIKIQQWFRFYLFRTMKARKRRKKAKRKISREVKKDVATVQETKTRDEPNNVHVEEIEETLVPVAVLVSRKADNNKSADISCSDTEQHEAASAGKTKKNKGKKGAVRSVTVKKATGAAAVATKAKHEPAEAMPISESSNSRASQTDNRVPKTRRAYR